MGSWGEQYSVGDQSQDSRKVFWQSGFSTCPLCNQKKIKNTVNCAGCRHNGDGYGTEDFTCTNCNWTTSFQYDEADSPYYYETRYWINPPPPRVITYNKMTKEDIDKANTMVKLAMPREAILQFLTIRNFDPVEIQTFLDANCKVV